MILLVRDAQGTEVLTNVTNIAEKDRTSRSLTARNLLLVKTADSEFDQTIDLNRYTVEVLPNG